MPWASEGPCGSRDMQEGAGTLAGAVVVPSCLHSLGDWGTAGSLGGQSCFSERCPRVSEVWKCSPAPLPARRAYTTCTFLLLAF